MEQTVQVIKKNKKMFFGIFFGIMILLSIFPFISSLTLDSTIILNTTISHSAITFSFDVNVSEVVVEPTYIYLKDVSYIQSGEAKTCSSINYSTANSVLNSANFPCDGGTEVTTTGGGGYPTFNLNENELIKGYQRIMYKNWKISFIVNNESHTFKVENVTETNAKISLSSEPQEAVLFPGEEKKFELSGDNYYDLLVKLNSIDTTNKLYPKANFTLQKIHEEIIKPQEEIKQTLEVTKNKNWIWWVIAFVVLVLIGLKLYLDKHKHHKKR